MTYFNNNEYIHYLYLLGAQCWIGQSSQRRKSEGNKKCGWAHDCSTGFRSQGKASHTHGTEEWTQPRDGAVRTSASGNRTPIAFLYKVSSYSLPIVHSLHNIM